ncbi:hypothetical protein GIB67_014057 [Kingdonia uniflora]|uniref:Retrotransposon gag domain-containing protein n=1 Tax=Kingdonia uniflora TaxID=39325 RepID=A0A7J7KXE9_9MAGN|nr:hypothetical protein GIB67_014057 [Kingdonia uniflora]
MFDGHSLELFVGGRGKIGFLFGTEKEPVELDSKYAKWFSDDSMIRTWLINSIQSIISAGYLFTNNAHLIWESLCKVYSQQENNARIFQLSNKIGNFKQDTQTLGMYYARLRSSWEELSHYDSFIEWPAGAPSENVPIPPTTAEIYTKNVEKTRSRRSPISPILGIPSETSAMAVRYAYPAPPSVPSQTSHTSSPSLSPLPAASGRQPPTPNCQVSSVAPGLPPAIDLPLSGIEPSPTAFIPVTTDDDSPVSHSDDDKLIAIRKEKRFDGWNLILKHKRYPSGLNNPRLTRDG